RASTPSISPARPFPDSPLDRAVEADSGGVPGLSFRYDRDGRQRFGIDPPDRVSFFLDLADRPPLLDSGQGRGQGSCPSPSITIHSYQQSAISAGQVIARARRPASRSKRPRSRNTPGGRAIALSDGTSTMQSPGMTPRSGRTSRG